jgi:hypothetical protein
MFSIIIDKEKKHTNVYNLEVFATEIKKHKMPKIR